MREEHLWKSFAEQVCELSKRAANFWHLLIKKHISILFVANGMETVRNRACMNALDLTNFSEIPYDKLEELNLEAKQKQIARTPEAELEDHYLKYMRDEHRMKAVTVCFSDLEGRFHMLDYDKKFLLDSHDNLTFDGSSVQGFSEVNESDLRLKIDWGSFRWLPADIFGQGKVSVMGLICDRDGTPYPSDMRGRLKVLGDQLYRDSDTTVNISCEIEGFLFNGLSVEQEYSSHDGFEMVSTGGYYNSLPKDPLKLFIDKFAEAKRALGFENEKDHPEVAPSQFELNYKYAPALVAADQVQMYKLLARQVAANFGCTATFLPKPIAGINGSGMHTNMSISRGGKNIFFDASGKDNMSTEGWDCIDRILNYGKEMCLILNPSVNAYRRLDPHYEAPNQIRCSAVDRTSMVRIPLGNEKSARLEVRTVAPDANPYMAFFTLIEIMLKGDIKEKLAERGQDANAEILPSNIWDASESFKGCSMMAEVLGESVKRKYLDRKEASALRCPKELGDIVKTAEILFHHEVTNQYLWSRF